MIAALALLVLIVASPHELETPAASHETNAPVLGGVLKTAGERDPIGHARVLAVPVDTEAALGPVPESALLDPSRDPPAWMQSTATDEEGRFWFEDLPASRVRLIVIAAGYMRLEVIVDGTKLGRRGAVLFAVPDAEGAMRTVVETPTESPPEQVSSTIMDAEEIRTAPGTQGDPLRALQNLPGVARTPGGFGLLVLRGASPSQSRVFLGGHALPRAFHSLAIASVVPAAAIDRMEFVPSNFGSRYGDATGGVVVLHPAKLKTQRVHGHARLDLLGAGALASGPLKRGAWLVAAQRGSMSAALSAAERVDPTQAYTLPRYYNYQAFFEHPAGPDGVITARVLGAGDRFQARAVQRNSRPTLVFEMVSQFHRADLSYRVRRGPWKFWLTPSARVERNGWRQPLTDAQSIRDDAILSIRAEATRALTRTASLTVGADTEVDWYRTEFARAVSLTSGELFALRTQRRGTSGTVGVYAQSSIKVRQWTFAPGVRASAFALGPATKSAVDPRLSAHWRFAPRWRWSAGAGLYTQSRIQQATLSGGFLSGTADRVTGNVVLPSSLLSLEPRAGFSPTRGGLSIARAAQVSTALSRELGESWFVELGGWTRIRDNADGFRVADEGDEVVTSTWSTAYGLEALVRRRIGPKLWGWVGYTLSRVEDRVLDLVGPPTDANVSPSPFDQRHNLVVLASYRLPRRWRFGGRFRLVSGSPFTDVVGVVWVPPGDMPLPAGGPRNQARFPTFHQLDLRVDKSWLLRRVEIGAYIDVQNVYNRLNPEAFIYSADYSRRVDAIGLPIFPSLGFRIDY